MSDLNLTQSSLSVAEQPRPSLSKLNLILIAALLVQILVVAWVYWPRNAAPGSAPLLSGVTADQVTRLRVADADDNAVELERTDDGWALANTDGFPANSEKISTTLGSLIGLTTDRLVTSTSGSHSRLQVAEDDFVRQITLTTPDGDQTIYLGSSAGAGATHVRLEGDDATYLTGELASWELEATPSSWVNAAYFSVPPDEVVSLTLQNAAGTLTFIRDEAGEWALQDQTEDEQVLSANISTLVTRATGINLIAPLGTTAEPAYGMDDPLATLTLQTENEEGETQEYTLLLGAKDEASNAYVFKASSSPYYVHIATFTGDEFANKTRADFLGQPEAEAGAEDAGSEGASSLLPQANPEPDTAATITETGAVTASPAISAVAPVTAGQEFTAAEPATQTAD